MKLVIYFLFHATDELRLKGPRYRPELIRIGAVWGRFAKPHSQERPMKTGPDQNKIVGEFFVGNERSYTVKFFAFENGYSGDAGCVHEEIEWSRLGD